MKTVAMVILLMTCAEKGFAQTGKVVLAVIGIEQQRGGELSAGIFKGKYFPQVRKQFIGKEVEVDSQLMIIVFDNVPAGEYGVAVFQDIDRNKDLKTNFIDFPQEPIGFSNDARIK
jgi:uncharacterized protein (DUF2141 family)